MALPHRPGRVDFNDLDWLVRQLDRYWPRRRLQLFIEEFGWNTEHEASGWLYVVSRRKQAARLTQAFRIAAQIAADQHDVLVSALRPASEQRREAAG